MIDFISNPKAELYLIVAKDTLYCNNLQNLTDGIDSIFAKDQMMTLLEIFDLYAYFLKELKITFAPFTDVGSQIFGMKTKNTDLKL